MRRVCYVCGILYGIKEPLEDDRETHGLCPDCFKLEMAKIYALKNKGTDPWKKKEPTS